MSTVLPETGQTTAVETCRMYRVSYGLTSSVLTSDTYRVFDEIHAP